MAKHLFKNIGFLTTSQMANYLLPLLTIPYITRIVGPENYGVIEFATTAMLYFSAIVIFGFNNTATRKIAGHSSSNDRISFIFSNVIYTRLLLLAIASVLFGISLISLPQFFEIKKVLLFAFPIVIGWTLYPDFLFLGTQQLKVVALANTGVKTLAAILIFTLLRESEDYYLVLAINSFAQIAVGAFTLWYGFKIIPGLKFLPFNFRSVKTYFKSGWYVFLSLFFTRIYTFSTIIFLGFLLTEKEMGLFAAALKLVIVGQSFLFLPLGGALFPHLAKQLKQNPKIYLTQLKRGITIMTGITTLICLVVFIFPDFFVRLVFGEAYLEMVPYLKIMFPILIATTFHHFTLKQGLLLLKKDRTYLRIIVVIGFISLFLNYFFIPIHGLYGAAWIKLVVEILLALAGIIFFQASVKALSLEKSS